MLLRDGHPFVRQAARAARRCWTTLRQLEFVAVRTHSDTLRILQLLQLEDRLRLTTEHFMVLPAIVKATDLAVVMPRNIARCFADEGGYALIEPPFPLRDFTVVAALEQALRGRPRQPVAARRGERVVYG